MEAFVIIYLIVMFISLYLVSFFVLLNIKHRKELFSSPEIKNYSFVSILVPAYNEEDSIEDTIEHVANLNYPKDKMEIIVINDGSRDKTKEIVLKCKKKYPWIKLLDKKNSGKADSLNCGINISKGELIAVVDSDSFPSKDSLRKLIGYFNDFSMGAVTSFVSVRNKDANYLAKLQSIEYVIMGWTRKLFDFINAVFVTNGPLSVYRKEYVLKVGGFDTKTVTEDIDITWNLMNSGFKTAMCLDARVSTVVPTKLKKYYNQRVRWGLGGLQALAKYRKTFFKRGVFGTFVLPFVSLSIFMSFFVSFYSLYLLFKSLGSNIFITGDSLYSGASLFHYQNINFYPSVTLFYTAFLFLISIAYYSYMLSKIKYEEKLRVVTFFNLCFYILVYLSLYIFIWIPSIYRYIRKNNQW
jgi:cellulose synthase/poly-beta-1,6-N-acetylglucosamine synthase-like glycosyltransferase